MLNGPVNMPVMQRMHCTYYCQVHAPAGSTQMAAAKISSSQQVHGLWPLSQWAYTQVSVQGSAAASMHADLFCSVQQHAADGSILQTGYDISASTAPMHA
jgi:hypothetical protein